MLNRCDQRLIDNARIMANAGFDDHSKCYQAIIRQRKANEWATLISFCCGLFLGAVLGMAPFVCMAIRAGAGP